MHEPPLPDWTFWDEVQRDYVGRPSMIGAHLVSLSISIRHFADELERRMETIDQDFDRTDIEADERQDARRVLEQAVARVAEAATMVQQSEREIVGYFST